MKKIICLCLLTLALTGLIVSAGATGTEKAVLASSSSVQQDKTVAISVSLSGCDVADGYSVELIYDKDVFELVGGTWQPQDKPFGTDTDEGIFLLDAPEAPNRQILTFTLRAKENAKASTVTEVSCKVSLLTAEGEIPVTVQGKYIKIACPHDFRKNETSDYLVSAATCLEPAVYYKSCARCGEADENQTFTSGKPLGHNFKDREITEYLKQAGDCQNRNVYYVSCAACGIRGEQLFEGRTLGEHIYDSQCDEKCNVCFEEREVTHKPEKELSANVKGHWYACTRCDKKIDLKPHNPGPEATEDTPQVCLDCGFEMGEYEEGPHTHEFAMEWSMDGESHWVECACGEKAQVEVHEWNTTEPTYHVCQICGYLKELEVQNPPTQPTEPVAPAPVPEDNGMDVAVIVLGVLAVLSLVGNVVLTILLIQSRKKRK